MIRCRRIALASMLALAIAAPAAAQVRQAQFVSDYGGSDSSGPKNWEVACPAGLLALGGGEQIFGNRLGVSAIASVPLLEVGTGDPIGWFGEATEIVATATSWSVGVSAICGRVEGLERHVATSASTSVIKSVEVSCPAGKEALSGGFELLGSTTGVAVYASYPAIDPESGAPTGWIAAAYEETDTSASWSIRAEVLCANETSFPFASTTRFVSNQFGLGDLTCPRGWIATGGGRTLSGNVVEWIDGSEPSSSTDRWSVRTQRAAGETAQLDNVYYVLCPEPGALANATLALAGLAAYGKRRTRRA